MQGEEILFDHSGVKISTTRATIGGKTYAMANITSVTTSRTPANRRPGYNLAFFGGLILLSTLMAQLWLGVLAGIVMIAVGMVKAQSQMDQYHLMMGSSSGEAEALVSFDKTYIHEIVSAVNEAIVRRG